MTTFAVATREGARLAQSSRIRTAVVAATIGAAAALGVLVGWLAVVCGALAFAVLVVARRSPRPERLASASVWARAGASRFAIWMAGSAEALLLGWPPALAGAALGAALLRFIDSDASLSGGVTFLLWLLAALALGACLPTGRVQRIRRSNAQRRIARVGVAARAVIVAVALVMVYGAAVNVRTDFGLSFAGALIVPLLAIVGLVVTGPAPQWIVKALERVPRCRAAAAIAGRNRSPGTVRFIIVAALTVATATAILGASVEARADTRRALDLRMARLPVLPNNVALLQVDPTDVAALDSSQAQEFNRTELTNLNSAIAQLVPGAEVIELRDLGPVPTLSNLVCSTCSADRLVVADPRLRSIYQGEAIYPPAELLDTRSPLARRAFSRVPTQDALLRAAYNGDPLPPASFAGAIYYEVLEPDAAGLPTKVRSVFVRAPAPLTAAQLTGLSGLARTARPAPSTPVTLIGPSGQIVPEAAPPEPVARRSSLRSAPWAATSTASRWSLAVSSGLIALVALLVTLIIDTLDRRRDVQRLERIGATPGQVRGAAALRAAALFLVATWVSVALVAWLVSAGTGAFTRAKPEIPVPFTMPWAVVFVLAIGLPALAAGLSALVARPARLEARPA